jgi:hypothetical protein
MSGVGEREGESGERHDSEEKAYFKECAMGTVAPCFSERNKNLEINYLNK